MIYRQFQPDASLAPYIDAYWTVKGMRTGTSSEKIMPDGCVDIIINLGEDLCIDRDNFLAKNSHAYLVGTMTRYKDVVYPPGTDLLGIRFKPAAFPFFYDPSSLREIADKTVEFGNGSIPEIRQHGENIPDLTHCLNKWFSDRLSLSYPKQVFAAVVEDIHRLKGIVTVEALAKRHFISRRQLERLFMLYAGIGPKEFSNFIRYRSALERIRNNQGRKSLLEIAFESGYYDHAHLSNEIMKYTGIVPSMLPSSSFLSPA